MYLFKKEGDRSKNIKLINIFWLTLSILYFSKQEMIFIQRLQAKQNKAKQSETKRTFVTPLLPLCCRFFLTFMPYLLTLSQQKYERKNL